MMLLTLSKSLTDGRNKQQDQILSYIAFFSLLSFVKLNSAISFVQLAMLPIPYNPGEADRELLSHWTDTLFSARSCY